MVLGEICTRPRRQSEAAAPAPRGLPWGPGTAAVGMQEAPRPARLVSFFSFSESRAHLCSSGHKPELPSSPVLWRLEGVQLSPTGSRSFLLAPCQPTYPSKLPAPGSKATRGPNQMQQRPCVSCPPAATAMEGRVLTCICSVPLPAACFCAQTLPPTPAIEGGLRGAGTALVHVKCNRGTLGPAGSRGPGKQSTKPAPIRISTGWPLFTNDLGVSFNVSRELLEARDGLLHLHPVPSCTWCRTQSSSWMNIYGR